MRDPMENVSLLQKQLNDLQLENQILKNILDRSGISYTEELKRFRTPEEVSDYDLNQGARILHPREITDEMANLFFSRFWGRHLPVTINTDDKGIFATSLLNEYMLVAKAMSKREGLLTERKWSDKRIEDYLLATISQSRQAKFKWSNNEYEAHRY